jgi:hypothetical protein
MRKKIAAAAMGAALLAGGGAGAALMAPVTATAADESTSNGSATETEAKPGQWVTDALSKLVDADTITQAQADAVAKALEEARPEGGPMGGHRGGPGLSAAATAIGIEEAALRTALEDGQTIAEVAAANNVDVQKVIDAIVAEMNSHLAEAVTDGHLTQAQADEMKANATERATALVNGERPAGGPGGPGGPGFGGRFGPPPGAAADDSADSTSGAAATT